MRRHTILVALVFLTGCARDLATPNDADVSSDDAQTIDAMNDASVDAAGDRACFPQPLDFEALRGVSCDLDSLGTADGIEAGIARDSDTSSQQIGDVFVSSCLTASVTETHTAIEIVARKVRGICGQECGRRCGESLSMHVFVGTPEHTGLQHLDTVALTDSRQHFVVISDEPYDRVVLCRDGGAPDRDHVAVDYVARMCDSDGG